MRHVSSKPTTRPNNSQEHSPRLICCLGALDCSSALFSVLARNLGSVVVRLITACLWPIGTCLFGMANCMASTEHCRKTLLKIAYATKRETTNNKPCSLPQQKHASSLLFFSSSSPLFFPSCPLLLFSSSVTLHGGSQFQHCIALESWRHFAHRGPEALVCVRLQGQRWRRAGRRLSRQAQTTVWRECCFHTRSSSFLLVLVLSFPSQLHFGGPFSLCFLTPFFFVLFVCLFVSLFEKHPNNTGEKGIRTVSDIQGRGHAPHGPIARCTLVYYQRKSRGWCLWSAK